MKKLMIAAAIVCAAAMSQAAAIQWTLTGVKDHTGVAPSASHAISYTLYAWALDAQGGVGDAVMIMETRPLSKDKRWRVCQIIEKAK